ncbi:MAG: sulfite exporter TauE/SafE family protein [Eubacteriales bacterium]|nr:sulfite exporter TauE/SafE family protein [Eubacteriales bacterium]
MSGKSYTIISGAAAVISGFVCGFIGSGGGIILLLTLNFMRDKIKDNVPDEKNIYAVNIASVVAMSAVSAAVYSLNGNLPFKQAAVYMLPAAAGGLCGAFLLQKIKTSYLNKILAAVTIYAGVKMLL